MHYFCHHLDDKHDGEFKEKKFLHPFRITKKFAFDFFQ